MINKSVKGKLTVKQKPQQTSTNPLKIVHITDMHVKPHKKVYSGVENLLKSLENFGNKPDILINTGDNIMDSLRSDKHSVVKQWTAWKQSFKENVSLDIVNCIGNHDIWGWQRSEVRQNYEINYGKQWAMHELELHTRYYSVDKENWRFIVLDSTHPHPYKNDFISLIDDEQFLWLEEKLAESSNTKHVCIVSHVPLLNFSFVHNINSIMPKQLNCYPWTHHDTTRLTTLFARFKHIKLCLSGHTHMHRNTQHNDIQYITGGSVCGGWWKGKYILFPPAFAVLELFADGVFKYDYRHYKK